MNKEEKYGFEIFATESNLKEGDIHIFKNSFTGI